jgi:hypothetical protein
MSEPCSDCGMDTEPWPPHRGTQEHYLVLDDVWKQAGMPLGKKDPIDGLGTVGGGILCVGCIEKRLGRLLTIDDFQPNYARPSEGVPQYTATALSRWPLLYGRRQSTATRAHR